MKRREWMVAIVMALVVPMAFAGEAPVVEVWKSDSCGCCAEWVKHLQKNGFATKVHRVEDNSAVRRALGIPERMGSCHTAKVGGYAIEGHVPASDIHKLLREKPQAKGLAAPGMPQGSPGMDIPNSPPYETYLVRNDGGATLYGRHEGPKGTARAPELGCKSTPDPAATRCGATSPSAPR